MRTERSYNPTEALQLSRMEHVRAYAGNQAAIAALELVTALSNVLIDRFGPEFASAMQDELMRRAKGLETADFTSQCTASIVAELANWHMWKTDIRSGDGA